MQKRFKFDPETMMNILKSMIISIWPALAVFFLGLIGNYQFSSPEVAAVVAWSTSNLAYIVYKVRDGKLSIDKLLWSVSLSVLMAGAVYLQYSNSWCPSGQECLMIYAAITWAVPSLVNGIKEYIAGVAK
jgi:hypothetical protein